VPAIEARVRCPGVGGRGRAGASGQAGAPSRRQPFGVRDHALDRAVWLHPRGDPPGQGPGKGQAESSLLRRASPGCESCRGTLLKDLG